MNESHTSTPLTGRRILLAHTKSDDAIARALRMAEVQVNALALTVSIPPDSAQFGVTRDRFVDDGLARVVFSSWGAARAIVSGLLRVRSFGTYIAAIGEATA